MATGSPEQFGPAVLWHALLHDLRGCLGGMKATLDLREPGAGLETRDAARLESALREGLALLELARAMGFGPWPEDGMEPPDAWAKALTPSLEAMAGAFRGKASLAVRGEAGWPGPLSRSFALSLARLLMPQALPEILTVEAEGQEAAWTLRFSPVLAPPLALQAAGEPRDLHGLWVKAVAARCRMEVSHAGERLTLRIPRGPEGLPPVE